MRPLYEALKSKVRKHSMYWTFLDAKAALANATMLAHPSPDAPIAITTDASDYAVGEVHEQWVGGAWQPLAFFCRQLRPSEQKYSCWRAGSLQRLWTTNLSHLPWPRWPKPGLPTSSSNSPTSPSSLQTSKMLQAKPTVSPSQHWGCSLGVGLRANGD